MASLNQCNFIGNVGKVETKYLASGDAVTNISLAVNETYKNKQGEKVENTEWVRVSFFGKVAEIAEKYVSKGDPLYVSGSLKTNKYTDKDGQEKYSTEIRGKELVLLGRKSEGGSAQHEAPVRQSAPDDFDDSIPF